MLQKTAPMIKGEKNRRDMTDDDIYQNALTDPDNLPLSEEQLSTMKRSPRIRVIRRALRMTQEEFASKFRIPLETIKDWEASRSEPDQPSRAYLRVIASNPDMVLRALNPSAA